MPKNILYTNSSATEHIDIGAIDKRSGVQMQEIATRIAVGDWWGMGMLLPNPDPVLRKAGLTDSVYEDLLTDGHLYGLTESRKGKVLDYEWDIDRGKSKSSAAKSIRSIFDDFDVYGITQSMLNAVLFGYQPLEIMWERVGNYIVPVAVEEKPRGWFSFDSSNNLLMHTLGQINGMIVRRYDRNPPAPNELVKKFLLPRHKPTYANPYGNAILSKCYWNIMFKRNGKKFWAIFLEKYGMPWVILKYIKEIAGNTEKVNAFVQSVVDTIQDGVIAIPEGYEASIESASVNASTETYERFLNDSRLENAIAVLGHTGTSQPTPGKLGSEDAAMAVAGWIAKSDRMMVTACWNELVRWIYELNFGTGDRPQFIMYQEEDVDMATAERDVNLYAIGWRPTDTYFTKTYSMEKEDFTVETAKPAPAPLPNQPPVLPAEFSASVPADQKALEDFIALSLGESGDALLNVITPVREFLTGATSFESAIEGVVRVYPKMKPSEAENMLARVQFAAQAWGRYNAAHD